MLEHPWNLQYSIQSCISENLLGEIYLKVGGQSAGNPENFRKVLNDYTPRSFFANDMI
jgi:hypothetical protein